MKTLTVRISQSLDDALQRASVQRHMSKSAMVREALEKTLASELDQGGPAAAWVKQWRGALAAVDTAPPGDARVAHILAKHLR